MVADAPRSEAAPTACFHCGAPLRGPLVQSEGRHFCCLGCRTVFDLLSENDMSEFYRLGQNAGVRMETATGVEQFRYLDEPVVRQSLVDFADARTTRVRFKIPAIHCIACVWLLENLFRLKPGIGHSQVNFPRQEVSITLETGRVKLSELVALLASLGYEPELKLSDLDASSSPIPVSRRLWLQIGVAGFAFGNIMLFSISSYLGLDGFSGPALHRLFGWLSLALALPVVAYSAADYWKTAWRALRHRTRNIETPIALGIAALGLRSAYEVVEGRGAGYFDSLTGLVFFLLCGQLFQRKTYDRLAFDRDYRSFFPLAITRKQGSVEERVALSGLKTGDRLLIRNGELIPSDSRLVEGPALIDYSFVTGESEPVEKQPGDHLYAGGRQMGASIEVETVKAVSQSYLTSLWNQQAFQKPKSDQLDTLINRYSRGFTRMIIIIAAASALYWWSHEPGRALAAFTSVLIVACPCALALASPFTLGTAQRVLARSNIFVRNTFILETLARVNSVVLDKTGTLTSPGAESVVFHGEPLDGREEEWIFSLARHSTHPCALRVGETIGRRGTARAAEVRSFKEQPGAGILGLVAGHDLCLGSAAWLASRGVVVTTPGGGTGSVVHVAIDGRYRGCFVLANALRPQTSELITRLRGRYQLALLSGDNDRDREKFRELFGSSACLNFNQSPVDKLEFVRGLQKPGRVVMMVGDGLNDAGALQQSDVGAAVVESIGAFSPASDVIIEAGMVPRLADVLDYARSSVRMVRLGFLLSGVYNAVGVTIAARGQLSPVTCAILMPLSSVTVVAFACGLTRWLGHRAGLGRTRNPAPAKESTP